MSATDVARKWAEAINRRDTAGFAALYAPTAVLRDPQYPEPLEGREAIQKDLDEFLRVFPDLEVALATVAEARDGFAAEGSFSGTQQAPLPTAQGEIPPSGKRVTFNGAGFYRLDAQGRIMEENRYYDLSCLIAQVAPGS